MNVLSTILRLQSTNSPIQKREILQEAPPLFQEVLKAAYDPFIMYHIKRMPWHGEGDKTIEEAWPEIQNTLSFLASRFGDAECKDRLKSLCESLSPVNAEVLKGIVKKDLRAGISATTINLVFPGLIPVFGPMKAKLFSDDRWYAGLLGSVKLDGLRCHVINGKLYTMNGHILTGLSHIEAAVKDCGDMDGELTIPGMAFQDASGRLRSFDNCPNAVFNAFDHISENMPFKHRYERLQQLAQSSGWSDSVLNPTTITLVKHTELKSLEAVYKTFNKVLDAGFEGLMLKTPDHLYQHGKRSADWMKLKNVLDTDIQIADFYEGEGRLEGSLGGVIAYTNQGVEVRIGGGFSDQLRQDIWNNKEVFRGRTIEVHFQEKTRDGSLRHPRFKRFRPDKD